jgi:hypothetical protein
MKEPAAWGIAVAACVVGAGRGLHAALIVVAAGVLGILLFTIIPAPEQRAKERGA